MNTSMQKFCLLRWLSLFLRTSELRCVFVRCIFKKTMKAKTGITSPLKDSFFAARMAAKEVGNVVHLQEPEILITQSRASDHGKI
jgi:hypothetical protein